MGLRCDSLADLPPKVRTQVAVDLVAKAMAAKVTKCADRPLEVKGIKFACPEEAERYLALRDAVCEGVIYDLRLRQNFTLREAYTTETGDRIGAVVYQADFTYLVRRPWYSVPTSCSEADVAYWSTSDTLVIESVKSKAAKTRGYINKKRMMEANGYIIREV